MKSVCHSDAEELHITELSAPELEVDEVEHDVRESLLLLQVQAACRQCTKGGAFIKSGVQRDCRHLWRHSTTSNRLELKAFASRLFTLGVAFVFLVYFETGRVSVDIEKVTKTQAHTHTTHTHTHKTKSGAPRPLQIPALPFFSQAWLLHEGPATSVIDMSLVLGLALIAVNTLVVVECGLAALRTCRRHRRGQLGQERASLSEMQEQLAQPVAGASFFVSPLRLEPSDDQDEVHEDLSVGCS